MLYLELIPVWIGLRDIVSHRYMTLFVAVAAPGRITGAGGCLGFDVIIAHERFQGSKANTWLTDCRLPGVPGPPTAVAR